MQVLFTNIHWHLKKKKKCTHKVSVGSFLACSQRIYRWKLLRIEVDRSWIFKVRYNNDQINISDVTLVSLSLH